MSAEANIHAVMQILELPMSEVEPLLKCLNGNADKAQPLLTKFKLLVKKQRRYLAKKYHPDMTAGNEDRMKQINNVVDNLLKSRINIQQPVRPTVYQYTYVYTGAGYNQTTTSTYYSTS